MDSHEVQQVSRYFTFSVRLPDSGNIQKDKAEIRIQFERAMDNFYEKTPAAIHFQNDIEE